MFFTSLTAASIYNNNKKNPADKPVVKRGAMLFLLVVFLIEIALFIWALSLALRCGRRHQDTFVHLVFAFFFPLFYILYFFISGCNDFQCVSA